MAGSGTEVPRSLGARVEALLRSLVGVTEAEACLHASGNLECVRVVSDGRQSSGQVVQNVRSALLAGVGVALKVGQVELVDAITPPVVCDVLPEPPVAPPVPASAETVASNGTGNGVAPHHDGANGHRNGNGHGSAHVRTHLPIEVQQLAARLVPVAATAAYEPLAAVASAPARKPTAAAFAADSLLDDIVDAVTNVTVETVEIVRQTGRIRCRVVLGVNTDRFSAVADAAEDSIAEVQLAGRVTVDALRAGNLTSAVFEGATIAYLASRVHVVVALTEWRHGVPVQLTGAAVVHQTLEEAAAQAVLQALPLRRS